MKDFDQTKFTIDSSKLTLAVPIQYAGRLRITKDFEVRIQTKPRWFHLKMMKLMFGWTGFDN